MAVKCNIPGVAIQRLSAMYYGFSCIQVDGKIAQNYLEYLHCPNVDFEFCYDFPCIAPGGDVLCTTIGINIALVSVTINTATVSFTPPIHSYTLELIRDSDQSVVDTKTNPTSPVVYTGLLPATNYTAKLTQSCPGGEVKSVEVPILTMPTCVEVEDFTAVAEDVNEYT